MKILFTGDVNFRGLENLSPDKSDNILKEVKPYIEKADFVIPNLECPLADIKKHTPIKKSGPNLICPPENVCFLKALNASAATLANNHIGDYGAGDLIDTIKLLQKNNIAAVGAGKNLEEAYGAFYIEKENMKIAVLSVCENEFGIADEYNAGSAGYNPGILLKRIRGEKEHCDRIIIVFHGGNEFNPLPSPDACDRYRLLCDMGADAVIAGHTHCPQGFEVYDGKPIIYSMGNFLFKNSGKTDERDSWYYGYLTMLDIAEKKIDFEIIPYKFDLDGTKITVFRGKEKEIMMSYINNLSEIIQSPEELKSYFKGWARLHKWCPSIPEGDDVKGYNAAGNYNLVKCEAHLSQLKALLEIYLNDDAEKAKIMADKITDLQKMPF